MQETLRRLHDDDARDRVDGTPQQLRLRSVTPEVGRFLHLLVKLTAARRILELGTSGGYSTIWLASAARETDGHVTTLELDPAKIERARHNFASAGLGDIVTTVDGDARQTIEALDGPFDLIFLDAEKEHYLDFLETLVRLLRPGGVLVADNLLSHAEDLSAFRQAAEAHPELECLLIPIPRGELLCRRRTA